MISFTIDGIKKLGEHDPKYGQRFWATTTDGDLPLMFNVMDADFANNLESGPFQIVAEEKSERESNKGTAYLMLKKVKLVDRLQPTGGKVETTPPAAQLDRIETMLTEVLDKLDELRGLDG